MTPARGEFVRMSLGLMCAWCALAPAHGGGPLELDPAVEAAERRRVETIAKVIPPTVAVFDGKGEGGGSGVILSPDGIVATNFHVVAPCGPYLSCGLPEGSMVPAVLIGVDPPGDVALVRLLEDREYPHATLGDSDAARVGDEAFVVGNPFLLADDLQPTVTFGVLSGVHRYQYPAGTILEYADCLQTDAAINPGNSGGPLFNARGELIGVNGRASFEKRGRVNVGVGYAISINQVKRFLPFLKSGRIVDHALLGATVRTLSRGRVVIDRVDPNGDAARRGLRYGDEVVSLAGRTIDSANMVQNVVATYPPGWRLRIVCRRGDEEFSTRVRLAPAHPSGELEEIVENQLAELDGPTPDENAYEARAGYVNYRANREQLLRVLESSPQVGTSTVSAAWRLAGVEAGGAPFVMELGPDRAEYSSDRGEYWIDPTERLYEQRDPPGSGGLLATLSMWRRLLVDGPDGFQEAYYLGRLPWSSEEHMCDVVVANHYGARAEFYFSSENADLLGVEWIADNTTDSCRVLFDNYQNEGGPVPSAATVMHGDVKWVKLEQIQHAPAPTQK